jgi:hypothetical protein
MVVATLVLLILVVVAVVQTVVVAHLGAVVWLFLDIPMYMPMPG